MRTRHIVGIIGLVGVAAPARGQETPPPNKVAVGSEGYFQPGVLLQPWVLVKQATDDTQTTFRIRRAELHVRGEIVPKRIGYAVMIDPAKVLEFEQAPVTNATGDETTLQPPKDGKTSVFQDVLVTFKHDFCDVTVGQFKIPVSWEGSGGSSKLLFPERALVSREFGDARDIGLRFAKTFEKWGYVAGVWNGTGLNKLDNDDDKDAAVRLEVYPLAGLTVAGVVYGTVGERDTVKDRYEGDLRFERGPFLFQSEYIRARTGAATKVDAQGFYGALGWTFNGNVQPIARVGLLDPDVDGNVDPASGKDEVWAFEGGLNYYLRKNEAKLQASWSHFAFDEKEAEQQGILAAQVAF